MTVVDRMPQPLNGDLLRGAESIGAWLGLSSRWVYNLANKGRFPCFRLGNTLCARKSTLASWIASQERENAGLGQ